MDFMVVDDLIFVNNVDIARSKCCVFVIKIFVVVVVVVVICILVDS